jgi:hypothetical protein
MASSISAGTTSSTALVCTADTSGALVLQTNNGTTALTLSTAQNATFAGTLATSSRGIAAASMPAGSVLQVVTGTTSTAASTTSTTFQDTGLTATITPTSSTSKILIIAALGDVSSNNSGSNNGVTTRILRGATQVGANTSQQWCYGVFANQFINSGNMNYLDSPATTSSTTYKIQFRAQGAGPTVEVMRDSTQGSITLMEIAV